MRIAIMTALLVSLALNASLPWSLIHFVTLVFLALAFCLNTNLMIREELKKK